MTTRREQATRSRKPRSNDYPKDTPDATDYLLAGIPADLLRDFDDKATAADQSRRRALLGLMERVQKGEIRL